MKILVVHNKYKKSNLGGEDIVYENEVDCLQGHLGKNNVFNYEVSNDEITKRGLMFGIWHSKKFYNSIKKVIQDNDIDLVHVHNFYPLLTPSVFKASKDAGAKVVHTLHNYRLWCISGILYRDGYGQCALCVNKKFSWAGIFNRCYRRSFLQSFVAQCSFWFYRSTRVFDNIDFFFVLTEFQKRKVISFGINEARVILKPNSVNAFKQTSSYKSGYIFVGRLEESKGIVELLKVWKDLDNRYCLTIIGDGELRESLEDEYRQDNICFLGKCSREKTLSKISNSKYLIQSSFVYETFGLTIIEAMSLAVPVIGFDIGTRPDFIKNEINGFLCEPWNLRSAVENSYNYDNYDVLCVNALETAKNFTNDCVIKKQIQIYKGIVGGNLILGDFR